MQHIRFRPSAGGAYWAAVALFALSLGACAGSGGTTSITSTYRPPDAQPVSPGGLPIAAVFISQNPMSRQIGEDALVEELREIGANGVSSYSIVPDLDVTNRDRARKQLEEAGIETAVVMRVTDVKEEVVYTPAYWNSGPYSNFWGYWNYGWGSVYEPGYLRTETNVQAETLLYSLTNNKLVWAGNSRTFDPKDVNAAVRNVAEEVVEKMVEQRVLRP
jgi:hypothetical protein